MSLYLGCLSWKIHNRTHPSRTDEHFSGPVERDGMSDRLEFRHLKYLIAVAEEENISRAARRLYLAQPSLSDQLKKLEEALLLDILIRDSKGVQMTEAGNVLILGARNI